MVKNCFVVVVVVFINDKIHHTRLVNCDADRPPSVKENKPI